ncbi:elongation factor Ts [Candidatus Parcubacteria bacterium]|nr:MAG: elongation factor Ts [Candidatus Parcubacteria bacterium]
MEKIKILREKTGAGIVDCKKALEEAGGDIEKAAEILRKKGIAKAAKRSEREASEGIIKLMITEDAKEGYMIEVNSETDFVARNEKFQQFAQRVLEVVAKHRPANLEELLALKIYNPEGERLVSEELGHLSGVIGEKLNISRFAILSSTGTVAGYSHLGGRIGVLVSLDQNNQQELAHDIAMQIAAANPRYLSPEDVPDEEKEKERSIYREQLLKEGKPEHIIDKIIEGKQTKYFEEICLLNQEFIKDDKKKVKDVLGDVKVEKFIRFSL